MSWHAPHPFIRLLSVAVISPCPEVGVFEFPRRVVAVRHNSSPLRAAPKLALLGGPTYVGGIIDTDTTWPNLLAALF